LHSEKDGKEYILELNDTAIGLVHAHAEEDMGHIRDLGIFFFSFFTLTRFSLHASVLLRLSEAYPKKKLDKKDKAEKGEKEEDNGTGKKKKKKKHHRPDPTERIKQLEEEVALLTLELERLKNEKPKKGGDKNAKKEKKGNVRKDK